MKGVAAMQRSGGSSFILVFAMLIGLCAMVGPWFISQIPPSSQMIIAGVGSVLFILSFILIVVMNLFIRTRADESFVRTGGGGAKCIIDGGALVIPFLHQVKYVPLTTFKLSVDRQGQDALITKDFLRADVEAVFYVRVPKEEENILQAASSLPDMSAEGVLNLVGDKLVSALRTVAAQQTLHDLNSKRADFAEGVLNALLDDLKANGLSLESVTISRLDQSPLQTMQADTNVFDAQGARTIAELVQAQRVARNQIEREADQKVKEQDVTTAKFIADQEMTQAQVLAGTDAKKKISQAEAERDASQRISMLESEKQIAAAEAQQQAETVAAEQQRIANLAKVQSDQAVKLAQVEQQRSLEVANQQREQAMQVALVEKQRAVELAERQRQIAIAEAEKQRAETEALQLAAQNEREAADQAVETTRVVATAERDKQQRLIAQQAAVEQERIKAQMEAEVKAYALQKQAEGEQLAAERKSQAQITLAQAERQSKTLTAEGEQAIQMVPVNVSREQVSIDQARVTVKRQELAAQAEFQEIARTLQVDLARIEAEKEARIAAAEAMGRALAAANLTIWGDKETVDKITGAFMNGQSIGSALNGLLGNMPEPLKKLMSQYLPGDGDTQEETP
ncbi:MAG: hypothetical protein IT210_09140 [Armatimonadetes bacterium]|nr:hypothetical protein [Armatimonadota bacterium]